MLLTLHTIVNKPTVMKSSLTKYYSKEKEQPIGLTAGGSLRTIVILRTETQSKPFRKKFQLLIPSNSFFHFLRFASTSFFFLD